MPEQIREVKNALLKESRERLNTREHWVQLALNEAEALAWQTRYPHLVFNGLAAEKIQKLEEWIGRQRDVRKTDATVVLAA